MKKSILLPMDFETGIPPPPPDDSEQAISEIKELLRMQKEERTAAQIKKIIAEDRAEDMAEIFIAEGFTDLQCPAASELIQLVLHEVNYFLMRDKQKYGRQRPTRSGIAASLFPAVAVPSYLSYPSKHAGEAFAVAHVLAKLNPAHEMKARKTAQDIARRREVAGLHYPSDIAAARIVADNVVTALLQNDGTNSLLRMAQEECGTER